LVTKPSREIVDGANWGRLNDATPFVDALEPVVNADELLALAISTLSWKSFLYKLELVVISVLAVANGPDELEIGFNRTFLAFDSSLKNVSFNVMLPLFRFELDWVFE